MGGGDEKSTQQVKLPKEVRESLTRLSGKSEDLFDLKSDFFKDVMMPYQKSLMDINNELLPFVSQNMKQQLQIQSADMMGDAATREALREAAAQDIERSSQLGDELFGALQEKLDIDAATTAKRSQLSQEFGKLEQELTREGLDPTSPESRALKKELEMEQTKASVQARTDAENEAFAALVSGSQAFQGRAMQNTQASMAGSMAGANAKGQQFGVASDTGMSELTGSLNAQNMLARESKTTMTQSSGGGLAGIGAGIAAAGLGSFAGTAGGKLGTVALDKIFN